MLKPYLCKIKIPSSFSRKSFTYYHHHLHQTSFTLNFKKTELFLKINQNFQIGNGGFIINSIKKINKEYLIVLFTIFATVNKLIKR